jgi:hypothetical protein
MWVIIVLMADSMTSAMQTGRMRSAIAAWLLKQGQQGLGFGDLFLKPLRIGDA